jgi:hypothetical protein
MDKLRDLPPALSIKQPWVDLILRKEKTIEVREWRPSHHGALLIHASNTLDWKTVELFGYDAAMTLPRGGIVAIATVAEILEFTDDTWMKLRPKHCVIHPPVRQPIYGMVLGDVVPLKKRIPCRGQRFFFPVPREKEMPVKEQLKQLHLL